MQSIKSFFGRLLVVLAVTAFSYPAFAAYDFVSINYPGAGQTEAFGINNPGTVVGSAYDADFNLITFYTYDSKKGRFTAVAPPAGNFGASAAGINEPGEIVGNVSLDGVTVVGFVRSKKGVYTTFSHPGSSDTEARANNNNGLVTGLYFDDNTGNTPGFIYDTGSKKFTDILPGPLTIAQGVNNQGQVVGSAVLDAGVACTGCPAGRYGWLRAKSGAFSFFQVNGSPSTNARGITDSGVITGYISTGPNTTAGFVTQLTGSASFQSITIPAAQLLVYPGAVATFPEAIGNDGTVVGNWDDADGNEHGFIATPHKGK